MKLVANIADDCCVKGELIFGKGSSFIAEYVFDLSKLLVEGGCASVDLSISPSGVHELVEIYEVALDSLGDFDSDYQRYRNE